MSATAAALAAMTSLAANARDVEEADLAITDLHVVDVESGEIHEDRVILIDDGRIYAVREQSDFDPAMAARVVAHPGAYAMPGLWDMHVHFRGGEERVSENAALLEQYLGFGITAVRDAGGDLADTVDRWRREIAAGERDGPRIFTPLLKLDGPGARWPGTLPIDSPADITLALDWLQARGADYVKVYSSTITPELYLDSLRAAERRDMTSSGHLPFAVTFESVMEAGLDSVEHALYLHKAASSADETITQAIREASRSGDRSGLGNPFARLLESEDEDRARSMFRRMAEADMAVTPTLYIDRLLRYLDQENPADDPRLEEIPRGIRETYRRRVENAEARSDDAIAFDHKRIQRTMALVPMAAEEGVRILAGSDAGAFNSYVFPGDSLHRELALLVEAGLSPLEALQAATIDAAGFLGETELYGTLEAGKTADILMLSANPLADIAHTREAVALVQGGAYMNAQRLEALRTLDEE